MYRRGMLVMLLSTGLFCIMAALVRGIAVDPYTTVMVRFVVGVATVAVLFALGVDRLRWSNWRWIVIRGVSGGTACALYFWCIANLGLAKAMLFNSSYAGWAALLAIPILGERVRPRHWAAIAVSTLGIALLSGAGRLAIDAAHALGAASGLVAGMGVVSVAKCRQTDSAGNIFWSQSLFGAAIVAWPAWQNYAPPTAGQWAMLLAIGLLAAAGQLTMTYAYKYTGASNGSLLALLTPVFGAAVGLFVFHEHLGAGAILGGTLVLLGCLYLSLNPVESARAKMPAAMPACRRGERV